MQPDPPDAATPAIDRARWQRLSAILDAAVELSPEARERYVMEACGTDAALRAEVEELLAASAAPDDFLASPAAEQAAPLVASLWPQAPPALVGQRVGAYRLVRELGEGGMGVVYLAERADGQFDHQVAVKLLKQDLHGIGARRRFLAERQLLARLQHPAIAHLFDGGVTSEGVPYFVMERVEGVPITTYCREAALDIEHRLRIFLDVCDAVQYAHEQLVVHRDLKPSNILVDAARRVKLLDFGIAKIVSRDASAPLDPAHTLTRIMTPEHAAPEQIRGEPPSPSTDVYALGVLLYELLTGQRPYRVRTRTVEEIQRAILEQDPRPTRIDATIDRIVLTALAKEPGRRYPSAHALASDVRRYLDGLPVVARADPVTRRVRKLARKLAHGHPVAATAACVLLLASAAAVATMWQVNKDRGARTAPAVQPVAPALPAVAARRSIAVLEFQNISGRPETAWLAAALPEMLNTELAAGGKLRVIPSVDVARMKRELNLEDRSTLARDAAVRAGSNLKADLLVVGAYAAVGSASDRRVRVDVRLQDGSTGEIVGEAAETGAERQLFDLVSRAGAQVRERLGIPVISPAEQAGVRAAVPANPDAARLYAEGLARLGVLDAVGARELLEQAVAAEPGFPLTHAALVSSWKLLGYDQRARIEAKKAFDLSANLPRPDRLRIEGRYHEVTGDLDKAIAAYRALFALSPDSLEDGLLLAGAQGRGGRRVDALATVGALRRLPERLSSDPRIDMEDARQQEDMRQYLALVRRAAEKAGGQGAPLLRAKAQVMECNGLTTLGQVKDAWNACNAALHVFSENRSPLLVAETTRFLGDIRQHEGRLAEAMELHRQALEIDQKSHNEVGRAVSLNELANDYEALGDLKQAEQFYRASYGLFLKAGLRFQAAVLAFNVGNVLLSLGRLSEADKLLSQSLVLAREAGGRGAESTAVEGLAALAFLQGNLENARQQAESAVSQKQRAADRFGTVATLGLLVKVVAAQGDLALARQKGAEALAIAQKISAGQQEAEARLALAELDLEEGRASQAESVIRDALRVFEREKMRDDALDAHIALARCLLMQGRTADAHATLDQARGIYASSQHQARRLAFTILEARVKGVRADLLKCVNAARTLGLVTLEYEARLMLAEVLAAARPGKASKDYVTALERDARARGFGLVARKAATVM